MRQEQVVNMAAAIDALRSAAAELERLIIELPEHEVPTDAPDMVAVRRSLRPRQKNVSAQITAIMADGREWSNEELRRKLVKMRVAASASDVGKSVGYLRSTGTIVRVGRAIHVRPNPEAQTIT